MATREELIAQADHLAAAHREREAAELLVQALGPRPYPVLICADCSRVTGWLGDDGRCYSCRVRRLVHESNSFAAGAPGGFELPAARRGLWQSAKARAETWLAVVEPDDTGPIQPEDGWETELAVKTDVPAPDGTQHRVVRFDVQSVRFERGTWRRCGNSRGGKPRTLVPREFPAALPIEQLAEAWNDFREEVAVHNRAVWAAERARRDAPADSGDDERGTAALLG